MFRLLGVASGLYLVYLGLRALFHRAGGSAEGPRRMHRPFFYGLVFGATNPKSYPVATAMFTAIALPYAGRLGWADAPKLLAAAFVGFVLADVAIVFAAGLPAMRRLFARHGRIVTRAVGALFIAFGAKSIADAGRGFATNP